MKRLILSLAALFIITGLCVAQSGTVNFSQTGVATQNMTDGEGLVAAHQSIPVGTKVIVTNTANNRQIELTIIKELDRSYDRVIDLSPSAGRSLGFEAGKTGIVNIRAYNLPRTSIPVPDAQPPVVVAPPPESEPVPASVPEPAHVAEPVHVAEPAHVPEPAPAPESPQPIVIIVREPEPTPTPASEPSIPSTLNLTIHNYITMPDTPEPTPVQEPKPEPVDEVKVTEPPPREWVAPPPEFAYLPPYLSTPQVYSPAPPRYLPAPPPAETFFAAPVNDVLIVPGLPDPYTDKTYRLQVGAYSGVQSASLAFQQLKAAGFDALQERTGEIFRVYAVGIPAARVYYAAQRLGAFGFNQIWVWE